MADWQMLVALSVVAVAVTYLVRRAWLAVRGRGGCGNGCGRQGNDTQVTIIPVAQIRVRRRPGP